MREGWQVAAEERKRGAGDSRCFNVTCDFLIPYQMSLEDILDLGYFACETVNTSFAAVNQFGISDFSPPSRIKVYGGEHISNFRCAAQSTGICTHTLFMCMHTLKHTIS